MAKVCFCRFSDGTTRRKRRLSRARFFAPRRQIADARSCPAFDQIGPGAPGCRTQPCLVRIPGRDRGIGIPLHRFKQTDHDQVLRWIVAMGEDVLNGVKHSLHPRRGAAALKRGEVTVA